ncbi:beta-lactamase family protein [Demequina sp. B12]|uniref:serine hydrolase domain-containing protein n=1 Tax=Demequina sp. B12 TaxID=2992757 RepID=UPI00237BCB77|nr:serine hydrolase domain-containing protein [Demequina sp. B12]MDE0573569.1 beta-lactamase family protein [Demequina sp. B12]
MDSLLDDVRRLLPPRHTQVWVAIAKDGATASRTYGVDADADGEIGSITKGLTGLLYSQALARDEIDSTTRLGDLLDLGNSPAAHLLLGDVAIHRSGLPRLPRFDRDKPMRARVKAMKKDGTDPYGDSLDEWLAYARATRLKRARYRYSNLGYSLLGHALAGAAGQPYAALLDTRVLRPVGMHEAYVAASSTDLRTTAVGGVSKKGVSQSAWTGEGIAPAGMVRAGADDLEALLRGLAGITELPGADALEPLAKAQPPSLVGAAWMTTPARGRTITWHNGMTGGFASFVGADREAGTGVAVMSAVASDVTHYGFAAIDSVLA